MPGAWGEFLRLRGALHGSANRLSEAYHDLAQSASVFELIGEGYQGGLSHFALGRLASRVGARSQAVHQFALAASMFEALGAARDLVETQKAVSQLPVTDAADSLLSLDADDAVVRRLVDAAAFPELLGHETAAAVRDTLDAETASRACCATRSARSGSAHPTASSVASSSARPWRGRPASSVRSR
jgi:hypothetical protein